MAMCDVCGNFDDEHTDGEPSIRALPDYKPDLYYNESKWKFNS